MKVLFISSGNNAEGISIIVKNQGESLIKAGVELSYFTIRGKGSLGYLKSIFILRKYLKTNKYDVIHAHYSLSAYVAGLAGARPLVVSLMGSDTFSNFLFNKLIWFFSLFFWEELIVKSMAMKEQLKMRNLHIIPNGVDLTFFKPVDRREVRKKLGYFDSSKHIVFIGDPSRSEKNFQLAKAAVELLDEIPVQLHIIQNEPNNLIAEYLNAADVLILTSLWEGSPNVIKEAMASNCPIVCTDVGDAKWVIGSTEGCYITSFKSKDVADKVRKAIVFSQRTTGRERIIELGLDSKNVASQLIKVYEKTIHKE